MMQATRQDKNKNKTRAVVPQKKTENRKASYHHGDLRAAVIEAACEHLRRENADTLSLRALARQIGVSQTAPYRHFDSRNALFAGIATEGFRIMGRQMQERLEAVSGGAVEAMIALGVCYLEFSQAHAEKYQLFFDSSMVDFDEYPELQQASSSCFDILLGVIRRGQAEGVFRNVPETELAALAWSSLHGMASLLQIHRPQDEFLERPVGQAIAYLAGDKREIVSRVVNAIRADIP